MERKSVAHVARPLRVERFFDVSCFLNFLQIASKFLSNREDQADIIRSLRGLTVYEVELKFMEYSCR